MDKQQIEKQLEVKNQELTALKELKADILSNDQKKQIEQLEKDKTELQKQLDDLKKLEEKTTTNQINKETQILKDDIEVDSDRSYEIIKRKNINKKEEKKENYSIMYNQLLNVLWSEAEIKEFAENIDKVVRKYLDQELKWFPNSIKNSMSVGIQFSMMETLIKQWANWSAEFFTAFSTTQSGSATQSFEWLYKSFGTLWKANEFYILANKIQNITWYLADKKNIITTSKNIPELENPYLFKTKFLDKIEWSNQAQIDKLDINTLFTLHSTNPVDIQLWEEELKKIVNDNKIAGVITPETIGAIQKSLTTADKLLTTRGEFKNQSTELVDKISEVLHINIPFLWNLWELAWLEFPTDILWKREDWWVLNFVLWVLGFHGGIKWLHKEYIREKLNKLDIDNTFIAAAYSTYQKNINTTLTHESETSIWKICDLSVEDTNKETVIKAKVPVDYNGLKKSIFDNLSTAKLNPDILQKYARDAVTGDWKNKIIDTSKITEENIDTYLKTIIPKLIEDDFITSKKVDQNTFALAVMGGLVGDKYFIEWINLWLLSSSDYILSTTVPTSSPEVATNPWKLDVINGKIDFSTAKFTPEQIKNINFLIDEMNKNNITNPNTQVWILSVISKESWFIPKNELSYADTPNQDIRKTFWDRIPISDSELTELKKNPEKFFDAVYGKQATTKLWRETGNTEVGDGYKYRGRGFNQLTFKNNYKKYAELTGTDILNTPDSLNDPLIASKVALAFFTKWKDYSTFPQFADKNAAVKYFADINAGGHSWYESLALQAAQKFDIQPSVA